MDYNKNIFLNKDTDIKKHKPNSSNNNNNTTCNNCGKVGHCFSSCIMPITSVGVIAFKIINNEIRYLMIQRTESFGFVEFVRGKYSIYNKTYIQTLIDEMTIYEKELIQTKPFKMLWEELWGEYTGIQYRGEEQMSSDKFEQLKRGITIRNEYSFKLEDLLIASRSNWISTEWGFPKGRRNYMEKDLDCGFREFQEETGYDETDLIHVYNIVPYEEIFMGSNMKIYKNKYYVCNMQEHCIQKNNYQESEVKNIEWLSYDECMDIIRPYNIEKKNILTKINTVLNNYSCY
jgi:8-oxo-dGTP pyrophosphatase MutT (NUDIX family)